MKPCVNVHFAKQGPQLAFWAFSNSQKKLFLQIALDAVTIVEDFVSRFSRLRPACVNGRLLVAQTVRGVFL